MSIAFTPIGHNANWKGSSWSIGDDDALAELVARVALGQSRYVQRILRETEYPAPGTQQTALTGAIELLTATNPKEPWHRDGWLFQVISWIAAHLQDPTAIVAPPHMIHAHKGFDGVHLKIDAATGHVSLVVICEEKATENARAMIRDHIWGEFKGIQRGERDNELIATVTQLLETHKNLDVDSALENIIWKDTRAYRVAITVDDDHNHAKGQQSLFKGYNDVVDGNVSRRRGEVLYLSDLRAWMALISGKAVEKAKELTATHV